MSIGQAAGAGLRKLPKLLGRLLSKPGRMGEDFAAGIAGRGTRKGVGVSAGGVQKLGWSQSPIMGKGLPVRGKGGRFVPGPQVQTGTAIEPIEATQLNYSSVDRYAGEAGAGKLNSLGYGGQAAGYGIAAGGAGTLGYNMMKGDGTEEGHDENGIKNPNANEEMVKFREKFQKEKLGGSSSFSSQKYQALRGQSKWVDTAIKAIGPEQYKKMRTAVMNGELPPEKMHSFLTDAIAHDTEALKLAGKEPYVLPGIARTSGGEGRIIVMAPMVGKDKKTKYKAMPYGIESKQQPYRNQQ